ncbi:MAG: enoyl-CoA hydratase [Rhizobiaceae bacterium]|nr:enoyl-CoA hydratase [Rhizobiaceae bacterium]
MSQSHVEQQINDTVGTLVLTNRQKCNALPQSGWLSIRPVIEELVNNGARVVILCGAQNDFCAGADISEFDSVRKDAATARIYEASNIEAFAAIRNCPVPTIAKIRGFCLGGGFGLAAACDLRIATDGASFAVPAAKLGLGYPVEAMADIVQAIGAQNAKTLLFTAARQSADDMSKMGFLSEIVEESSLNQRVDELAQHISQLAPLTHAATKSAVLAMQSGDWEHAKSASDATFSSQDYAEGRTAFREKRTPEFKGI